MKNQYRTGVKSRELILSKVKEHGQPIDATALSVLTGLKKSHVRYTLWVMLSLKLIYLHHYEKNNSGRSKPFYFTEPSDKKLVKGG